MNFKNALLASLLFMAGTGILATGAPAQTAKPATPSAKPAAAPSPATPPVPVSADPASTSATYGDWIFRCQRVGSGDKAQRLCEVGQTIQVQGQQQPIAQIAFGRVAAADPLKVTVVLPTNITLPGLVQLSLGDKDPGPVDLTWRRCIPGGCIADATPTPDAVKIFRNAQDQGRLLFKDAGGRDVALPISFRGLAQSLDALAKG